MWQKIGKLLIILTSFALVHIINLGNGKTIGVENFGWGKVNRCFPQISKIYIENNKVKFANIVTGKSEYYTRVYRYIGKER